VSPARRMAIPVYYLGRIFGDNPAPWHYPFIMLAATTPLPILAGAVAAMVRSLRQIRAQWRNRPHEILLLWSVVFQLLLFAVPGVPKYDGVRLLLPAMPFLAILAGHGAEAGWLWVRERVKNVKPVAWGLGVMVAAWLLAPIVLLHPLQLSYYSELVGGPWGANRLGFETTYWNDSLTGEVLDWVVSEARPGDRVARVAVGAFVWKVHSQSDAFRRKQIRDGEFAGNHWEILLVAPRQGYWTDAEREFIRTHTPAKVWRLTALNRLPVCMVFRREPPQPGQ